MGKNAQRRRGDAGQPKVDHFILDTDTYINVRRFLGSRPHDETRLLIEALEQLAVVTEADMVKRDERAMRLAELEELWDGLAGDADTDAKQPGEIVELTDEEVAELDDLVEEVVDETLQEMAAEIESPAEVPGEPGMPPDSPDVEKSEQEGA